LNILTQDFGTRKPASRLRPQIIPKTVVFGIRDPTDGVLNRVRTSAHSLALNRWARFKALCANPKYGDVMRRCSKTARKIEQFDCDAAVELVGLSASATKKVMMMFLAGDLIESLAPGKFNHGQRPVF
jgi:hypothetical protein